MDARTQTFFILGVSKSGYWATKLLLSRGAKCYIYDEIEVEKVKDRIDELISLGAIKSTNESVYEHINLSHVFVLSPGIPINHPLAVYAKQNGKRVIGELELGFAFFQPLTVAVTGTNGKTTTVYLIESIVQNVFNDVKKVGNIGIPITEQFDKIEKDNVVIAEVSSFQLETVNAFCPHIACILNVSPDHLERHYSMENYIYLKKRIFKNQRESEYLLLNYDDKIVKSFESESRSKVVFVSTKTKVNGVYVEEDKIYFNNEFIMGVDEIALKGEHNLYDCLFAIAVSKILGVDNECIKLGIAGFRGVKHRIELVLEKGGIKYFNDSKATNTASTISAIKTMSEPTILILGGYDKGESYKELYDIIKNSTVKHVVLTGSSRFRMAKEANENGFENYTLTPDFSMAIKYASLNAISGESVLFSPATSSYDMFTDYEARGEAFILEVKALIEN